MPAPAYDVRLRTLRKAIAHRPPYTSGTVPVRESELVVYYGKKGAVAGRVDFNDASEDDLARLARACDSATFGRNDQDVLDESYRKAGKLDRGAFSVDLELERNGLMEIIRSELLKARDSEKAVHAELYKLNVYGEGSFFKSHKDTPRGKSMFGSLVVFYPTVHEGGALVFRDGDNEWTFDSAQAVAAHDGPCVAYAAFFSDVDHEVAVVRSGYRATVTYNLYFVDAVAPTGFATSGSLAFETSLQTLLEDPTFMPDGGVLGFGLQRIYPIMRKPKFKVPLDYLKPFLKGSDADILRACDALRLQSGMWMVYRDDGTVAVSSAVDLENIYLETDVTVHLVEDCGAKRINDVSIRDEERGDEERGSSDDEESPMSWYDEYESGRVDFRVQWVTKPSALNVFKSAYVSYGNEPELAHAYGHISLFVEVGKPGSRATAKD